MNATVPAFARAQPAVDPERVLEALDSARSREILHVIGEQPLTASEIAERCRIPTSTLYRHLNELVDTRMIEPSIRLEASGRHATQYARRFTDVVISIGDAGEVNVDIR